MTVNQELICSLALAFSGVVYLTLKLRLANQAIRKTDTVDAQKIAALVEYSQDAIIGKDLLGSINSWNKSAEQMFGYTADEMIGQSILRLFPADRLQEEEEIIGKILRGISIEHYETERMCKDGTVKAISLSASPIKNAEGKIVGIAKICRDITSRKLTEKAIRDTNEKLEERVRERSLELIAANEKAVAATQAKSDFLANMSHEIRTPINGIIGMAKLMAESPLNPEQERFLKIISNSSAQLLTLVNDILDLSKIEAGKIDLENSPVHLLSLVNEIQDFFGPQVPRPLVEFKTHFAVDTQLVLQADPLRIRQILTNLLSNAIKFTTSGTIRFSVRAKPLDRLHTEIECIVEDTGIGMSPHVLKKIFTVFTQADPSTSRRFGGTGLGLVICKKLVELMDGSIHVTSREGHGSKFTFCATFTNALDAQKHLPLEPSTTLLKFSERRALLRILLAEDNPVNQEITLRTLLKAGYQAEAVANGFEVLEKVAKSPYDLILMDCQMPEMDGFRATQILRANNFRDPIVALTANAFPEDRARSLTAGMSDHLSKPTDERMLIQTLDFWCLESGRKPADEGSPPSTQPVAEHERIDLAVFNELRGLDMNGGKSVVTSLVNKYLASSNDLLKKIGQNLLLGDVEAMRRSAHTLRSASAPFGVKKVIALTLQLEMDSIVDTTAKALLENLRQELAHAHLDLKGLVGPSLNVLVAEDVEDLHHLIRLYLSEENVSIDFVTNGQEAYSRFTQKTYDLLLLDIQMPIMDGDIAANQIREYELKKGLKPVPIFMLTAQPAQQLPETDVRTQARYLAKPIKKETLLEIVRDASFS